MVKGRPQVCVYVTTEAKRYKRNFIAYIKEQVQKQNFEIKLNKNQFTHVDAVWYFPRIDMDSNNMWKLPLDCLTEAGIWTDDNTVLERNKRIYYDKQNPRMVLEIYYSEHIGIFDNRTQYNEFLMRCSWRKVQAISQDSGEEVYTTNTLILKVGAIASVSMLMATFDSDYPVYSMVDDQPAISIVDRRIEMPKNYKMVVFGDSNSQLLTFEIDRYADGVDLSDKSCVILFYNAAGDGDKAIAVNIRKTDNKLIFGWLLDENVSVKAGKVRFSVQFSGRNEDDSPYFFHSLPAELTVEEGLWVDDLQVEERYPTIIEDLLIRLKELEEMVDTLQSSSAPSELLNRLDQLESSMTNVQEEVNDVSQNFVWEDF